MTLSPIGYNVLSTDARLWAHLDKLQPAALLFLNNLGGALAAKVRYPDCTVISRIYTARESKYGLESGWHFTPGMTLTYLKDRAAELPPNGDIVINLGCEPSVGTGGEKPALIARLVDETMKALEWALPRGIKVAAPHAAGYAFDDEHLPLIAPLADFMGKHRTQFIYTTDEYGAGHLFSGVEDTRFPDNERDHIRPETWLASNTENGGRYWHAGRVTHLVRYLRAHNLAVPRIIITETGLDALGDVTAWRHSLKLTPPYDDQRGWKSLRDQLNEWYGDGEEGYAAMLLAAFDQIWKPYGIEAALVYCYGSNNDPTWNQFDVSAAARFQAKLETTQGVPPVTIPPPIITTPLPPTPKPQDCGIPILSEVQTSGFINVRPRPSTLEGAEIYRALQGDRVYYFPGGHVTAEGFEWAYVELQTLDAEGHSRAGWMARVPTSRTWEQQFKPLVVSTLPPVDPPPPPPPPVDPPPVTPPIIQFPPLPEMITGTSESRRQWATFLHALADYIEVFPGVPITSARAETPDEAFQLERV